MKTAAGQHDASIESDGATDGQTACAVCGSPISVDDWHPVTSDRNRNGQFTIYSFCSENCRLFFS